MRRSLGMLMAGLARRQLRTGSAQEASQPETIIVDAHARWPPFPHFWEEMFGSGRANLAMRENYRERSAAW